MSVRRIKRRDPKTGAEREYLLVDFTFHHADGRRERVREVSPVQTVRGAQEYERQRRAELLNPKPIAKEVPTLKAFVELRWLPKDAEATNRRSTIIEKKSYLRLHILPQLGHLALDKIGTEQIAGFYAYLNQRGLSIKSRKNVGGVVHRILACALEWEVIAKLPKFPRLKTPTAKWDFFTREETDHLISFVSDVDERAILLFAFHTGARSGEQIALEWADIDWHNHLVVFRKASSRGVIGPTKDSEERKVRMTVQLESALKKTRHLRSSLVFCQGDGKPFDTWMLARLVARACKKAGLRRIRRHDTRHSFASQLVMAGTSLPQVQAWLGHSTVAMTMKYAHLAPNDGAELINALDSTQTPTTRVLARMAT